MSDEKELELKRLKLVLRRADYSEQFIDKALHAGEQSASLNQIEDLYLRLESDELISPADIIYALGGHT